MYNYIYFDLDDTLVKDNPNTGESEILQSGYTRYKELREKYPKAIFRLFTNRLRKEIWYPDVYSFEEYVGKDDMELYILDNINKVPWLKLLIPLNLYIYLTGLFLFKRNQTPKVLYLFFKHIVKGERVYVEDDDRRVTLTFRW